MQVYLIAWRNPTQSARDDIHARIDRSCIEGMPAQMMFSLVWAEPRRPQ